MKFRKPVLYVGIIAGIVFSFIHETDATLMLGSMMMAAKTGLMLGKMGVGGMLMMLLAAQQNDGPSGGYGKKRSIRSAGSSHPALKLVSEEEILLTERMVRQIDSTFDSLTCIPKFVCGMNTQPTNKKTSIMNDYGHLLKLMLTDSDEDSDEDKKGKHGIELDPFEEERLEDMVNDELMDEDPALLPFILKDVRKRNEALIPQGDMPPSFYPPPQPPPRTPLSSLSQFFPQVEAGLGTKVSDSDFDSDPFFAGFRSLKAIFENATKDGEHLPIPILDLGNDSTTEPTMTKAERSRFVLRKSKELKSSKDVLTKYRIAAEVGRKLKSKDECAKVFKKCPYKWDEVTGVVSNIRKAIVTNPIFTGQQHSQTEKIVFLKTDPAQNDTLMTIASAGGVGEGTKIIRDLGNGTLMEISMKLVPMPMVDLIPSPPIENLGVSHTNFKKPNKTITYPIDTSLPTRDPPVLEEALEAHMQSIVNSSPKVKPKPKRRPQYTISKPGNHNLPVLKEESASLPTPVGEDDEFEDSYPVLVSIEKTKKKYEPKKKAPPPKLIDDDGDEEEDQDDNEDEEDDDGDDAEDEEYDQGRSASVVLLRRVAPIRRIPPFPLIRQR